MLLLPKCRRTARCLLIGVESVQHILVIEENKGAGNFGEHLLGIKAICKLDSKEQYRGEYKKDNSSRKRYAHGWLLAPRKPLFKLIIFYNFKYFLKRSSLDCARIKPVMRYIKKDEYQQVSGPVFKYHLPKYSKQCKENLKWISQFLNT